MANLKIKGIYAITPHQENDAILTQQVESCLKGGASFIQYRSKFLLKKDQYRQSEQLKKLCDNYKKPLIINDNIELCRQIDADGVHLGKDDDILKKSRDFLGPEKIIGISCYNEWDRVEMAVKGGADYIALGACFETTTKPNASRVSLDMIKKVLKKYEIPLVAIGGINLQNISLLNEVGVNCAAIITSLFCASNIEQTVRQFDQILNENKNG